MGRDTFIFKKVSRDGTAADAGADAARNRTALVAIVVAVVIVALLLFVVL